MHCTQEKRLSHRFPVKFQVIIDDTTHFMTGEVRDLSKNGFLLAASEPLPKGALIRITALTSVSGDYEFIGEVVRLLEDVTVAPFDDRRFLLGIRVYVKNWQQDVLTRLRVYHAA